MSDRTDALFDELVETMLSEAESISCTQHEYLDGLKGILSAVRERVELVTDELKGQKRGDDSEDEDEEGDTESDED